MNRSSLSCHIYRKLSEFIKSQLISLLQHGEETGAQKEGLKTMLKEIEFLTGPDLIQQGQLEVILSLKSILFFSTIDQYLVEKCLSNVISDYEQGI